MSMACDIEWTLLHIIVFSSPDPDRQRQFHKMHMHEKIQNTIADLKTYKPDQYSKYKNELEELWEFKRVRNDMAHHKIMWEGENEKTLKVFKMYSIDEQERAKVEEYDIPKVKGLIDRYRQLNMIFIPLVQLLMDEKSRHI